MNLIVTQPKNLHVYFKEKIDKLYINTFTDFNETLRKDKINNVAKFRVEMF